MFLKENGSIKPSIPQPSTSGILNAKQLPISEEASSPLASPLSLLTGRLTDEPLPQKVPPSPASHFR
jgi:hypothetical protein